MDRDSGMIISSALDKNVYLYLKRSLLVLVVLIFYCNVAIYLSLAVSAHLQPQYWVGLFILVAIMWAAIFPVNRFAVFHTPLFLWCAIFLGLTILVFVVVPESHAAQLKDRLRDVALLVALLSLFLMLSDQVLFVRKVLIWAVLLGTVINLIGTVDCRFMIPIQYAHACRPAGFYINPNESATALLFGMILAIEAIQKSRRILFAAVVFVGVAATFSREAILGWLAIAIVLCISGSVNWKQLTLWTFVFAGSITLVIVILIKANIVGAQIVESYNVQLHRLVWFMGGITHGTSVTIRVKLLEDGWHLFLKHPWLGNGIGSTEHWNMPYATHNMYLYYMDDYGVIGALLYPLLVVCIVCQSRGEVRKTGWCMATFMLFMGLLNHDLVHSYYALFAIALMAAMSRTSADAAGPSNNDQPA
jgi:O-antigen ligase